MLIPMVIYIYGHTHIADRSTEKIFYFYTFISIILLIFYCSQKLKNRGPHGRFRKAQGGSQRVKVFRFDLTIPRLVKVQSLLCVS